MTQADYTYDPQPAPQPFGDLVSQHRDAESAFYQFDALGSSRALTDGSEVVTDEAAFEAFGKTAAASGTTHNPFQWVGQVGYYADEETGLYSLRRRQYASGEGRFVSEDPIDFMAGDDNLYRYGHNDPAAGVDPSGLQPSADSAGAPPDFTRSYTLFDTEYTVSNSEGPYGQRGITVHGLPEDAAEVFLALLIQGAVFRGAADGELARINSLERKRRHLIRSTWDKIASFVVGPGPSVEGQAIGLTAAEERALEESRQRFRLLSERFRETELLFGRLGFDKYAFDITITAERTHWVEWSTHGNGFAQAISLALQETPEDEDQSIQRTHDELIFFLAFVPVGPVLGTIGRVLGAATRLVVPVAIRNAASAVFKWSIEQSSRLVLKPAGETLQFILRGAATGGARSRQWLAAQLARIAPSVSTLNSGTLAALRAIGLDDAWINHYLRTVGDVWVFRGTTEGFAGNVGLIELGLTPTSIDPLIATVFAAESAAKGAAPILSFGRGTAFVESLGIGNIGSRKLLEREVIVSLLPKEFAARAPYSITLERARAILLEMGFEIPRSFSSIDAATLFLKNNPARLSPEQIATFIQKATGVP